MGLIFFCATLFVIFLHHSVGGEVVPYMVCENGPAPLSVAVNPCGQPLYQKNIGCVFTQGTQVKVEAAFIAPFDSNKVEIVSTATFQGHELHLPESGTNACLHMMPGCPIKIGRLYIFTYRFDIMKYYPTGAMDVKIMVRDRKSKKIVSCAKMSIMIIDNRKVN